jgi:F420-dependent oxidoreductase-like protein
MRAGLFVAYWPWFSFEEQVELAVAADRGGLDSVWVAEAWGQDAVSLCGYLAARTERIALGTALMQIPARPPAATAMAAATIDVMSGGRFRLGLGVSGPQVSEGWYGTPFARPVSRTREYVEIVRKVLAREAPVSFSGKHYQLPYDGGAGLGKALKSTVHPLRADVPIFLAAEGPKNVALAAEIADGWFPFWFSPKSNDFYSAALDEGFARDGARRTRADFEVVVPFFLVPGDDVETAANRLRPQIALYVGGMGAKGANFHLDVFARMGWEAECAKIQELYLDGRKDEAIASIPLEMVEDVAMVGPVDKLRADAERWKETLATTLVISGPPAVLRLAAELFLG